MGLRSGTQGPASGPYVEMLRPGEFNGYFHCAEKKATAVGIYTRNTPDAIVEGIGNAEFDAEGRFTCRPTSATSPSVSLYLPSGSSSEERQAAKFRFMDLFLPHAALRASGRHDRVRRLEHRPPGTRPPNWKSNQKNSGFLPPSASGCPASSTNRAGSTPTAGSIPMPPTPATPGGRTAARPGQNVGWRLDYQIATPNWHPRPRAARSTKTSASATMRPSRWITIIPWQP